MLVVRRHMEGGKAVVGRCHCLRRWHTHGCRALGIMDEAFVASCYSAAAGHAHEHTSYLMLGMFVRAPNKNLLPLCRNIRRGCVPRADIQDGDMNALFSNTNERQLFIVRIPRLPTEKPTHTHTIQVAHAPETGSRLSKRVRLRDGSIEG